VQLAWNGMIIIFNSSSFSIWLRVCEKERGIGRPGVPWAAVRVVVSTTVRDDDEPDRRKARTCRREQVNADKIVNRLSRTTLATGEEEA
jgi:hypothetical protein